MSIVKLLREEFQLWQAAWRQIEAFLERIDDARDKDEESRRKFQALLRVAAALEEEKRWRDGSGLDVPLEIAEARGEGSKAELKLDESDASLSADPKVRARRRLPGAYDLEIAIAPLAVPAEEELSFTKVKNAQLIANLPALFERYADSQTSGEESGWVPVVVPAYDFGQLSTTIFDAHAGRGLYDPEVRRARMTLPEPLSLLQNPITWSALRASRRSKQTGDPKFFHLKDALLGGPSIDAPDGPGVAALAARAKRACELGAQAINDAIVALADDEFPELDDDAAALPGELQSAANALASRAAIYAKLASQPPPKEAPPLDVLQLGDVGGAALDAHLTTVLDEVVAARIAHPDGTQRMWRAMEWAFQSFWYVRLAWFEARRKRRLEPLLIKRYLATFLASFDKLYRGLPTGLPFTTTLAKPAFATSNHLHLPARPAGIDALEPGTIAVIDGDRTTAALVLGEDPGPGGIARLRILPLRVSMAIGAKLPGVAGMITAATLGPGPVSTSELTSHDIRSGAVHGHPEHDGLAHEIAAIWSRLCLLLGHTRVAAKLAGARGDAGGDLPTYLPRTTKLPVLGPVAPSTDRLILDVAALRAQGFDLDAPEHPILARPGELLLLRGADEQGALWQGVVEVLAITRTTADKVNDETATAPGKPICCQGPGDRLVVQIAGTSLPTTLATSIVLHRDFQGFGAPSLATGALLPEAVDPDSHGADESAYRGPELTAARQLLDRWLWTRS